MQKNKKISCDGQATEGRPQEINIAAGDTLIPHSSFKQASVKLPLRKSRCLCYLTAGVSSTHTLFHKGFYLFKRFLYILRRAKLILFCTLDNKHKFALWLVGFVIRHSLRKGGAENFFVYLCKLPAKRYSSVTEIFQHIPQSVDEFVGCFIENKSVRAVFHRGKMI